MKKQRVLGALIVLGFLSAFIYPPVDDLEIGKRGAVAKEDLPDIVYNSIRMNDFDMLTNYIPNDNELEYLKRNTSRKNKYIYEGLSAQQLEADTRKNFEKVVEEGIKEGINWSTVEITDSKVEEEIHPDRRIYKGIFEVEDIKDKCMKVSFDIIKVKNKWFLFQGIRVEGEQKKASRN